MKKRNTFLKKFWSILLIGGILFGMTPPVSANDPLDELVKIVQTTVKSSLRQISGSEEVLLGQSKILQFEGGLKKTGNRYEENATITIHFDTKDFPAAVEQEIGAPLVLDVSMYAKTLWDESTGDMYLKFSNYKYAVETSDENLKAILDGFLEFPKFITEKMYHFNVTDLQKKLGKMLGDDLFTTQDLFISDEDVALLFEAGMRSGLFTVMKAGDSYTLSLTDTIKSIDLKSVFDLLKQTTFYSQIPSLEKEMIEDELKTLSLEDISSAQESLDMVREFTDFSLVVTTKEGKMTKMDTKLLVKTGEIFAKQGLSGVQDVYVRSEFLFTYQDQALPLPLSSMEEINFNKIIDMTFAIQERIMKSMPSFEEMPMDSFPEMNHERSAPLEKRETLDFDDDGIFDEAELEIWGTNPWDSDSDGDGVDDGEEIREGYDPLQQGKRKMHPGEYKEKRMEMIRLKKELNTQ